jgi:hypothetical protein
MENKRKLKVNVNASTVAAEFSSGDWDIESSLPMYLL